MPQRRRIKSAKITHVSLCRAGKNKQPTIFKAEGQNRVRLESLCKAAEGFDEKGELLAVVYAPEYRDSDGDIADAEAIKEAAYSFAKSGQGIDIEHDTKVLPKDAAYVAESFLIHKGDERFANWTDVDGNTVDVTGGWGMVVKIDDPELRSLYKSGDWNGVSMFGTAEVVAEKADTDVDKFMAAFMDRLGMRAHVSVYGDLEMTPDELKQLFKSEITPSIASAVAEGVKEAFAKSEPPKDDDKDNQSAPEIAKPVFKGDLSKAEDVRAHAQAMQNWKRLTSLNFDDPKELEDFAKSLEGQEDDDKDSKDDTREKKTTRKSSNVPDSEPQDGEQFSIAGIDQAELTKSIAAAKGIAAAANSRLSTGAVPTDRMS